MNKEKTEFEKFSNGIKNMPYTCVYCKKNIEKGEEERFEVQEGRHDPFCNIDCAINEVKRRIQLYTEIIKSLQKKEEELTFQKIKGK